jgi:hypothetical protein
MAYTEKTWVTGEKITAPDLNHLEQGVAANDAAVRDLAEVARTGDFGDLVNVPEYPDVPGEIGGAIGQHNNDAAAHAPRNFA